MSGTTIAVAVDVRNEGQRDGTDVPQLYVEPEDRSFPLRLAGWSRVALKPGETRRVTITVDPRLLARFDTATHQWSISAGRYAFSVRPNATAGGAQVKVDVLSASFAP